MTTVSIIGNGNMGQAISGIVTKGGNNIEVFDSSDADKPANGEIIILAVPYPAVSEVIAQRREQLAGKIVVDITNPLNFETFDSLTVPSDSSAAAQIAAALPESRVLKAFNTTFAGTLVAGTVGGQVPTTVLVAGDDEDAKSSLAGVIAAGGLRVLDAGALKRARELEAIGFVQLTLAVSEKVSWTAGFAVMS